MYRYVGVEDGIRLIKRNILESLHLCFPSPHPPIFKCMHTKLLLALQMFGGESHGFAWTCRTIM